MGLARQEGMMARNEKRRAALKNVSTALSGLPLADALLIARCIAGYAIYHYEPRTNRTRLKLFKHFVESLAGDLDFAIESHEERTSEPLH